MANKPTPADFNPTVPDFPSIGQYQPIYGKFDLTTYIQGASDYEIMAFLVQCYNATLKGYSEVTQLSKDTVTAYNQLQSWVNTWFDDLDVQQEINNKLQSMYEEGTLADAIAQSNTVPPAVTQYLNSEQGTQKMANIIVAKLDAMEQDGSLTNDVTLELFGAKGDGVTDDTGALKEAIKTGKNIKLLNGKTYGVKLVDELLTINNATLYSDGQSTIKSLINASTTGLSDTAFHHCFYLTGKNFTIKNVTFDANNEWVERPINESGDAWNNYLNARNTTIGNTKIANSENVNLLNVKFLNGLFSVKISNSSKIKVYECEFSKPIADGLYITDGTTETIVGNCIANYTGDDAYCVNVDASGIPERATFINCSGNNISGNLCKVYGGKNVSFVNCSGTMRRTAGISVEAPSESTWGKTVENIVFVNCAMKSSTNGAICNSSDTTPHKNVVFISCNFDTNTYAYINAFDGASFENCAFTNGFDIYRSKNINLADCTIASKNNLFFQDAENITLRNCSITNKCEIADGIHENRSTNATSTRRCINLMRGYIRTFGNSYSFGNNSLNNYDIAFDGHMSASGFQSKIDTSKILQENNEEYKILKDGVVLEKDYSIYNTICFDVGNVIIKKDGSTAIKTSDGLKTLQYSS